MCLGARLSARELRFPPRCGSQGRPRVAVPRGSFVGSPIVAQCMPRALTAIRDGDGVLAAPESVSHPRLEGRMKRIPLLQVLLLAAVLLLPPTPAPAQTAKPRAERPTYAIGDKWIRNDGVFELIRIEKGEYVFAAEGRREIYLTKNLGLSRVSSRGSLIEFHQI